MSKSLKVVALAAGLALLAASCTSHAVRTSFTVPPAGQPHALASRLPFPGPTAMAFDGDNRPYLMNTRDPESVGIIRTLRREGWVELTFRDQLAKPLPTELTIHQMHARGELVCDDDGALYATVLGQLAFSADGGLSFRVFALPGERASLQLRTGPQALPHPPAICLSVDTEKLEDFRWARRSRLHILLPNKTAAGLELGAPIEVTDKLLAIGSGGHSGGTSFAVSTGDLTHIVYTEVPVTADGGNPTWIATIDRAARHVVARELLAIATPSEPDVHARPTITADAAGYLHVIAGSHGAPFLYMRSLAPGTIEAGWTEPVPMAAKQTYAGIVCDGSDRLYSAFRQWRPHASLALQAKAALDADWGEAFPVVDGSLERGRYDYGIFYHRLFVDRRGGLFLAFTFYETHSKLAGRYPQTMLQSRDSGVVWTEVTTASLREGLRAPPP